MCFAWSTVMTWLSDPTALLDTLVTGALAYIALIVLLRVSGKRTLSKWNMFDFAVTVAFGSMLASAILSSTVKVDRAIVGFVLLIGLQFVITKLSVHVEWFASIIKADPVLLVDRGRLCTDAMRRNRVPEREVFAALRESGFASPSQVEAMVLETDGSFSVIEAIGPRHEALVEVEGFDAN